MLWQLEVHVRALVVTQVMSMFKFLLAQATGKSWTNTTLKTQMTHEVALMGVHAFTLMTWKWRPMSCSPRQQFSNIV
jgi:hypothetical protein